MTVITTKVVEDHRNGCRQSKFEIPLVVGCTSISPWDMTVVFDTITIVSFQEQLVADATALLSFSFSYLLSSSSSCFPLHFTRGPMMLDLNSPNSHVLCSNLSVCFLML